MSVQCSLNFNLILTTSTKTNISCELSHGIHITNLYKQRRQGPPRSVGILDILFPNQGPKKDKRYHPSIGYEAYWPGGDWVYSKAPNKTTAGAKNEMCGRPCSRLYQEYGPICARNRHFEHKTFQNYCKLHNEDCTLRSEWLIAYRGECQPEAKTYPTERWKVVTRAVSYISLFQYKHPATTINIKKWLTTTRKVMYHLP